MWHAVTAGCQSGFVVLTVTSNGSADDRTKPARHIDYLGVLIFIIPCLQFVRITVVGVLNGSDLALLVLFLYLVFERKLRIGTRVGKWTLILCFCWLVSQCVTDVYRHSAFGDYARGWSNIGLTFVNLAALWTTLYGQPRRLAFFGWGLAVGGVLFYLINPSAVIEGASVEVAWKFVFGFSVSLGVFLFASRRECKGHWPITLAVTMGIIDMVMGSRAMGGICLAAAFYLFVNRVAQKTNPGVTKLKARTVFALAVSILLCIVGVMWAYGRAASAGILGEDALQKYEQEASGKYGVLLGGRTELLASLPAVYDSPILGHGSWARDPIYIIEQHQALLLLGYRYAARMITPDSLRDGLIPAHSYLFQAWVDAGFLGAVFWIWILVTAGRMLTRVYPASTELLPAATFMVFLLLWNIPFSPYGTDARLTFPYTFVLLATLLGTSDHKIVNKQGIELSSVTGSKTKRIA